MKLNGWLDTWLNKYLKLKIKNRTFEQYKQLIDKHIVPILGDFELDDLDGLTLQDFIVQKSESGNLKTGKGLSSNTVVSIANVLKESINLAFGLGITKVNNVNKIVLPKVEEKEVTAFDRVSEKKLIDYCLNSKKRNHLGVVLDLLTGLRIGELLALKKEDFDFVNLSLNVSKTTYLAKVNGKYQKVVDTPKTKNSIRNIPLPKQLVPYLKENFKTNTSKYFLSTKNGDMLSTRSYQRTFEKLLKKLNIPYLNFHALRHTFATRLCEFGVDTKTISEVMGHKNPMITLSRYAHSLSAHKVDMINRLGKELLIK